MKRFETTIVMVLGLSVVQPATAQPDPDRETESTSEQEPEPRPSESEPSESEANAKAVKQLHDEMQSLRTNQAKLKLELETLKRKQAETPLVIPPPSPDPRGKIPLTPNASVGLRYDTIFPPDPYERFQDEAQIDGFRMRVRAGIRHTDVDAALIGGVRISLGQPLNPAQGYVSIGDAFRAGPVGLDRFWGSFRPFDDRSFIQMTAGKMPLPFWRGDRGRWRSELTWDSDVSPIGIALDIRLLEQGNVVVENTAGYFVMHDVEDLRFQGLTGPTSLIADQLRVRWTYLSGAFTFYDYENLNTGMSAPGAITTDGVSTQPASDAFLLRDGLQATNNRVSYGLGAAGLSRAAFRIINPSMQGHIPLPLDDIGKGTELFVMVDYTHNLSVKEDSHGIGGTAGIKTGDRGSGWLSPLELWFTYRFVEADATLATFADSNLGQGTDFRGFEIGASYDATESLVLGLGYVDYLAAPRMDAQLRRFMADVRWDY